jgi:hypothetical protein
VSTSAHQLHWQQIVSQLFIAPLVVIFGRFHNHFPPMRRCQLVRWLVCRLRSILSCSVRLLLSSTCLSLYHMRSLCRLGLCCLQRSHQCKLLLAPALSNSQPFLVQWHLPTTIMFRLIL